MRSVTNQPGVDSRSVIAGAVDPPEKPDSSRTAAHTAAGYDGAIGRANLAPDLERAGQLHTAGSVTRVLVEAAAHDAKQGATPEARLRGLKNLAKLADDHPDLVREALRYPHTEPPHSLDAYEVELAKNLGTEGARGYMMQMRAFADKLIAAKTPKVCLVNATFAGGGVAEMFQTQAHILRQLGIEVEWHKTWDHDGAYGEIGRKAFDAFQGGGKSISAAEHAYWAKHNALLARIYQGVFHDKSVGAVFLEDHHAVHFIPEIKKADPDKRIVWRSHVDMAGVLDGKAAGLDVWKKTILPNIRQLGPNDAVFFQPGSVPKHDMLRCSVFVCPPGIDPLAIKNERLDAVTAKSIIAKEVKKDGRTLDLGLKYTVTGGRFVAWKGNVLVTRAFLKIAHHYPKNALFAFAGIGTGDDRKIAERDLFDASLREFPEVAHRVYRMDDRSGREIGAAYRLAADSESPVVLGSMREGYGMTGDEAGRQGAVPVTFKPGGFSRYGERPETNAFQLEVEGLLDTIEDATTMYQIVDGKVVATPEAVALEDALAAKLREIYDARESDPAAYSKRYQAAADAAHTITLEHSSPVMARNYMAAVACDVDQLKQASSRVGALGAAHLACAADVLGEALWP